MASLIPCLRANIQYIRNRSVFPGFDVDNTDTWTELTLVNDFYLSGKVACTGGPIIYPHDDFLVRRKRCHWQRFMGSTKDTFLRILISEIYQWSLEVYG